MILTCPSCGTRYRADPVNFTAPGRNVRCAKCGHTWFQAAPEPESSATLDVTSGPTPAVPETARMVTEPAAHIAMADIREKRKGHKSTADRILQGLGLVLLLLLLAAAGWAAVHYRQTVVRLWPGSERLY